MLGFDLVARVRQVSPYAANALLNRIIPQIIPLAKGLSVKVVQSTPRRCELTMPVGRRARNHVQAMYIGAQMMLADLTAGVLIFQRFPMGPYAGIIKKVEADFRRKGKGLIRCVLELPPEVDAALEEVRTNESGKAEAWVPLTMLNEEGHVVTEVRFLVALKRMQPTKAQAPSATAPAQAPSARL